MFAILSLFSIPNFYRIILKTIIFPEKYEDLFFPKIFEDLFFVFLLFTHIFTKKRWIFDIFEKKTLLNFLPYCPYWGTPKISKRRFWPYFCHIDLIEGVLIDANHSRFLPKLTIHISALIAIHFGKRREKSYTL